MPEIALKGGKPVRKKMLVFGRPHIKHNEMWEVFKCLKSRWIGTGPRTEQLENDFKRYVGCDCALAVNSCTAAMDLALKVLGIGEGDEVITTPMTFASTANVIEHQKAKPVFVDCEEGTWNINAENLESKITNKTKAIMPVHLYGHPCDMDLILEIAKTHNLRVIEDAAHAIEAEYRGRKVGTLGDMTAFSFYSTKNMTTAEGGMLTTNNPEWAETIDPLRLHGISKDAWKRYSEKGFSPYDVIAPGFKYNMTDLQASIGIHQLARIERNLERRQEIFNTYNEAFRDTDVITTPYEKKEIRHARHLYTLVLNTDALKCDRNEFIAALQAENIGCGIHFLALHLSKYYQNKYGYQRKDFPVADFVSDRTVSLPLTAGMKRKDVSDVIAAVEKVTRYYRR